MRRRNNIDAWVLMLPMVIILYLFVWRPTVLGGVWSFFRMSGYSVGEFCGIDNYKMVLSHTQFMPMLWNTIQYVLWSLLIGFLPPLVIAIMVDEIVHFKSGFRVLIYLPTVIPGIAAMLMWYFMYYPDQTGLLNMLLSKIGVDPYLWLNDPKFAIIGIVIYSTWKAFPGTMLLYFAALQGVSSELYEAALIDGAGSFKRFWHVTRPGIEGLLLLNVVRQIISVFQVMEAPMAMTGGGPNGASTPLSLQLYRYGFNSGGKGTGQAMALGVIIFVILIVFTIFYFWLNRKVENRH
ncbi:MAG: sugar ABC transporter permease [Clostridia bacterium]|nr:sugar ABC transporter permease [Clostridia bacterium]